MKYYGRKPDYQGYNENEIFKNQEEMQNILSMKEIDREKFIMERIMELNSQKERQKLLGNNKQKPAEKKEKKHSEEDENYEQGEIIGKKEKSKRNQRKDSDSNLSSLSLDDDNKNNKKNREQSLKKNDIEKIKLTRQFFIKYIDVPDFDNKIKGAIVRVHLSSEDKSSRIESGYIIGIVEDIITKDKTYNFNGSQCLKYLKVKNGTNEQDFNFNVISNSPIEDKEFQNWIDVSKMHNINILSPEDIKKISNNLNEIKKYQFNTSERDKMFSDKLMDRIKHKDNTINITQVLGNLHELLETEKQKLKEEKDKNIILEKEKLLLKIQDEIESLENMKIERQKKEILRSQKDIVAKINEKKLKEQLNDETKFSFLEQKRNREIINDITKNSQYQRVDCRPKNIFGVLSGKNENGDLSLNAKESEVEIKKNSNKLYHLIRDKIAKFSNNLYENQKLKDFIANINKLDDNKQDKIDELVENISFYELACINPEAIKKLGESMKVQKEQKDIKIITLSEYI